MTATTATDDFKTAIAIYRNGKLFAEDLPDGMWEELEEAGDIYKDSDKSADDKESFAEHIKEICSDWGFPFC